MSKLNMACLLSCSFESPCACGGCRGVSYDKLGRWGEAVEDFTAVLRLATDPKQRANAYFNRGSAWDNLGQFQRALQDFQRALVRTWLGLGQGHRVDIAG